MGQHDDSDVFGDPSVAATRSNTRPQPSGDGKGTEDGTGTAPTSKPAGPKKIRQPRVRKKPPKPPYPDDAPNMGRSVTVRLLLKVNEEGKVISARATTKAHPAFIRVAKRYGKRIKFYPATEDGKPRSWDLMWEVEFQPED